MKVTTTCYCKKSESQTIIISLNNKAQCTFWLCRVQTEVDSGASTHLDSLAPTSSVQRFFFAQSGDRTISGLRLFAAPTTPTSGAGKRC